MTGHHSVPAVVRWFLGGGGAPSMAVHCVPGQEPETAAALVAGIRAARRTSIVVVAPTRSAVLAAAVRIAAELGPDARGLPQVAIGRSGGDHPAGVGTLHASRGTRPDMVAVKTRASVLFGGPRCELMVLAGMQGTEDTAAAARNAARLMILGPAPER